MQHRRRAALAIAIWLLVARAALAVTPFTHIETQISPSYTSLYTPPESPDAAQVRWPFTITSTPGGGTEGRVKGGGQLLDFFGPGLLQYDLATAYISGVARAEFGVLRAWAYAAGGVYPKSWGPPFVIATNPYASSARSIMRPQFTDVFVAPATAGAPNVGDAQVLVGNIDLHGGIGGDDPNVTWLVTLQIIDETTRASVFYQSFYSSGCGGPCPFPFTSLPTEFQTTVGSTYSIFGDLAITANAGGNAGSFGVGHNSSYIDASSTAAFFVRVKETGAGIVGQGGRDYGAAVPPSDLEIPTTTTVKIPPDSTTSTTTTTTLPDGGTTSTTTLPTAETVCDDCVDGDGDGLIDAEDPDCCTDAPLAPSLRKVKLPHGGTSFAGVLTASLSGAAIDPSAGGLTMQLRDPSAGTLLCARVPATRFTRKKKGKLFVFRGDGPISTAALRIGKTATTVVLASKGASLDAPLGTALQMTLASGGRCGTSAPIALRNVGKKGALKYP